MLTEDRTALYTSKELNLDIVPGSTEEDGGKTLDELIMLEIATAPLSVETELRRMQHDTRLLWTARELLKGRKVCGFMGGHRRVERGSNDYAACAKLARELCRSGCVILQGGGPGAMEAAALGAYFSQFPSEQDGDLDVALQVLAQAPHFTDKTEWIARAKEVLDRFPPSSSNSHEPPLLTLGVPTWVYGHEPSNLFSSLVCKCYSNALREEFLSKEANHSVFFFPGSMGTFQEAFQIGCLVHYDLANTRMVFVGEQFWTKETMVYTMLKDWAGKQPNRDKWLSKAGGLLQLAKEDNLLKYAARRRG